MLQLQGDAQMRTSLSLYVSSSRRGSHNCACHLLGISSTSVESHSLLLRRCLSLRLCICLQSQRHLSILLLLCCSFSFFLIFNCLCYYLLGLKIVFNIFAKKIHFFFNRSYVIYQFQKSIFFIEHFNYYS